MYLYFLYIFDIFSSTKFDENILYQHLLVFKLQQKTKISFVKQFIWIKIFILIIILFVVSRNFKEY